MGGLRRGDLLLHAGGVHDAQSLQRLPFGEAIGTRPPITVRRGDAMVDVIAVPTELATGTRE